MKIEDALKKACPFIRDYKQIGDVVIDINSNCIGEDCMAWKWKLVDSNLRGSTKKTKSTTDGYCVKCIG